MPGIGDLARDATELLKPKSKRVDPDMVGAIFDSIIARVKKGEVVSIQGFGNLRKQDRKATKARNPQTGAQFDVPASQRVKFTASKTLKEDLNGTPKKAAPAKAKAPKAAAAAPAATK